MNISWSKSLLFLLAVASATSIHTLTIPLVTLPRGSTSGVTYAVGALHTRDRRGGQVVMDVILDTGSSDLVLLDCSVRRKEEGDSCYNTSQVLPPPAESASSPRQPCSALVEDSTDRINFFGCGVEAHTKVQLQSANFSVSAQPPFLVAASVNVTNSRLHPWTEAGGILGIAHASLATQVKTKQGLRDCFSRDLILHACTNCLLMSRHLFFVDSWVLTMA